MSDAKLEARLAELESKVTLSEDLLDTLNLTIFRQQQQIDRLQQEVRALRDQVEAAAEAATPGTPRDEIPPHY